MTLEIQKKNLIIRRVLLGLLIFIVAFLQCDSGRFPQLFGIRALIIIPSVVAVGMFEKEIPGIFYGLFAGALWDTVASGNNFNAIIMVIAGYTAALLISTVMRCNIATHMIISAVFLLIYSFGYWAFHYLFKGYDGALLLLFRYYLPGILYTSVFSPFIFLIVRSIEKNFREEFI